MLFNGLWCKATAVVRLIKHIALSALDTYSSKEIKDINFFERLEVPEIEKSAAPPEILNEKQHFVFFFRQPCSYSFSPLWSERTSCFGSEYSTDSSSSLMYSPCLTLSISYDILKTFIPSSSSASPLDDSE